MVHGAGTHAPVTTLNELINPTLARLRDEGHLVSVRPVRVGAKDTPGGAFDGLQVVYTRASNAERKTASQEDARERSLLVVEARWDKSYVDPDLREVSAWSAAHVGRLMWEIVLYQSRGVAYAALAVVIMAIMSAGFVAVGKGNIGAGATVIGLAWGIAYAAALLEAYSDWGDQSQRGIRVWPLVAATTMMVYHVQRALVIVVALAGIVLLPALAIVVRLIGTIPGLDALARGFVSKFETAILGQAPTDVEVLSNNTIAAAAIHSRVKGALLELESRLDGEAELAVLAHSAGTAVAWWALSEAGIHERYAQKPIKYRLLTIAGVLNWSKRGMDCQATPLDMPLVASRADDLHRTYWLNVYTAWDPAPHGPVRTQEFEGQWQAWPGVKAEEPRVKLPVISWRFWEGERQRDDLYVLPAGQEGWHAAKRPSPNMIIRNLGSPISAEHSEYFRNQQEFVPALVRSFDGQLTWAAEESSPARHQHLANARAALLSPLVRFRMAVFSLPLVAVFAAIDDSQLVTTCEDRGGVGGLIGSAAQSGIETLPGGLGNGVRDGLCLSWGSMSWEDLVQVVVFALIAYALVEVYTSYLWQDLGRRVHSLDPRRDPRYAWWKASDRRRSDDQATMEPTDGGASSRRVARRPILWPPSLWRLGRTPVIAALCVWLPTIPAPLLFFTLYWKPGLIALLAVTTLLAVLEAFWFEQCLRGLEDPEHHEYTGIAMGRHSPFAG